MLKRFTLLFTAVLGITISVNSQGLGTIQGKVKDKSNAELLPFVSIVFEQGGIIKHKAETDFDGNFKVSSVTPGVYNVKSTVTGYKTKQINGFLVKSNIINFLDIDLESSDNVLEEVEIVTYSVPLIDKDGGPSGGTLTRDQIAKMPGRTAGAIANTVGGVQSKDGSGEITIRGARSDANYYFIDGVKVRGSTNLPKSAVEEISVITGGMPANYGDATGGIISITTRGPSSKFFGGVEYVTSGFKSGDGYDEKTWGLDKYAYNLIEGSVSGPLLMKKDSTGKKVKPLIGFFVSGNYNNTVDNRPFITKNWRVKEDVRNELLENPLTRNPLTGTVIYNTDFLGADSFEDVDYRNDAGAQSGSFAGKLDFSLGPQITLAVGGSGDYNKNRQYSFNNMLFNSTNNGVGEDYTWRVYGRFVQRFTNKAQEGEGKKKGVTNAYYSLMVDYQKTAANNYDRVHKDNLFNYGYVGRFETFQRRSYPNAPTILPGGDALFTQNGYQDTLVQFTPSTINADLAAITSQYYSFFGSTQNDNGTYVGGLSDGNFENLNDLVVGNALRNGDGPQGVYGLWNNIGTRYNSNGKSEIGQFRVTANGNADLGKHSITLGFEYEQRNDRFFNVNPGGLWFVGRLLQNKHINEIPNDPTGLTYYTPGSSPAITFESFIPENTSIGDYNANNSTETQSFFDYNVRLAMGLDPDGVDFLDIDAYDPEMFKLEFFNADELINNGANYVNYSGYDHTGAKTKGKTDISDFFNERDDFGNRTRAIGAFQPIYNSVFLMDKFAFDDLIFNVGVRVDRFDANQSVLNDRFLLFPAKTAGEITTADNITGLESRPSNIGDDYYVYLDDEQSRTVTGYRNGSQWYNAEGVEVTSDPSVIFSNSQALPVLKAERNGNEGTSIDAFRDYKPQINVMPRIAFSFPINDEALFFAHYDVLTKRPTTGNRLDLMDYYYINSRGSAVLNNPNLKPEKTIDYELGFQQVLTKSSSLKISAFYKELRNMVTVVQVFGAYPQSYKSFENIDFGTVKGLTLTYDLRRTQNLWMKASYTLQFAEGTGSNAGSQQGLINAGLPNLRTVLPFDYDQRHSFQFTVDYHYGEGKDYNGPRIGKLDLFANTGVNFITLFGSGTPYTAWDFPVQTTGAGAFNGSVTGNINGARMPGQFRMDINIDKNLTLKFGKKGKSSEGETESAATQKEQKTANLNVYFWITNLLNRQNINGVYAATGNPQDDGYLTDARYTDAIVGKNDPDAFRYYYGLAVNNPFNYGLPRQIRLGIKLDF
jgi:hypothetical protein